MKLKVNNFTIYNRANHKSINYWWNESEGELGAFIFCSIVVCYLTLHFTEHTEQKPKKIILHSDGFGYQNRIAIMPNALLMFSIQHQVLIEQKFLIKGHTQMECDAVHSVME